MKASVLLIEDSTEDRERIARQLSHIKKKHYHCIEAATGEQGIHYLHQNTPDCILLDYSLPGKDGLKILKSIRDHETHLPVIMLTRQGSESVASEALRQGAQNYLVKSTITAETLHLAIGTAIEHVALERRIYEQRKRIADHAEELEIISEELENFNYIASQDMRTPLASLRGFSGELYRSVDLIIPMLEKVLPHLIEQDREVLHKEICQRIPKALAYINTAADKMDQMTKSILKISDLAKSKQHPPK